MALKMSFGAKTPAPELEAEKPAVEQEAPEVALSDAEAEQLANEVDELATLLAWEAKQKKDARALRLKELKDKFQARAETMTENDQASPDEKILFEGKSAIYELGPQANVRTLKPEGKEMFANKVGQEAFFEAATIGLGVIDKYIPEVEQDGYFDWSRGSRSGKILDKKAGNAAKAKA